MSELPEGLLTMRQAETWLGIKASYRGRRLKRILLAVEKKRGRAIITRLGERGDRVTRSALRRYCPHLIRSHGDELREKLGEFMRGIDERIASSVAEHVAERVEPELEDLFERCEVNAKAWRELADRVKRIAGPEPRRAAVGRQGPQLSSKG